MIDTFAPFRNAMAGYVQSTANNAMAAQTMAQDRRDQSQNALTQQREDQKMSREEAERRVKIMGPIAKALKKMDPSQRAQAFPGMMDQVRPLIGGDVPTQYTPDMDSKLDQAIMAYDSLYPQQDGGFSLSQGQTRFDAQGNPIASVEKPLGVGGGHGSNPYWIPVQTAEGVFSFDARTGALSRTGVDGQPIIGSASDPNLQRRLAEGKAGGKVAGETRETAKIELPKNIQEAETTIKLIDNLLRHPGFKQAVGKSSMLRVQDIPGTQAKAFMIRQNQLKGKQFLQAFESLKGGGHITEIEGQKATEAMSRMDNANEEGEYEVAAREFQDIIRQGVERAKTKAGQKPPMRGARQAPDGNWYVEQGGRFFRVEQ